VSSRGVLVSRLAMFMSCSCVLLRIFVLAERVVMCRLVVMVRGGVVVSSRLVMMFLGGMFRCLCHLDAPL